jgi:hypothetical protein
LCTSRRASPDIEHIGSAHNEAELEYMKAAARQRMTADQLELVLGLDARGDGAAAHDVPAGGDTCWTPSGTPTWTLG